MQHDDARRRHGAQPTSVPHAMAKPAPPLTFAVLRAPDATPPAPTPTELGFGNGEEDALFCSFATTLPGTELVARGCDDSLFGFGTGNVIRPSEPGA